jgi:O-antigen/teichoic acid export membrane protein
MFFVIVVSLYTSRVVLNVLGVDDFGTYNVVCGFVSMFAFLNTAMSNATQRFYSYEIGKGNSNSINNVYTSALITQFLLMLVVVILVEVVGVWYMKFKMVIPDGRLDAAFYIFHFSVISFAFLILQVPYSAAIMAYEKMDYYALVSIIEVLLKLGIVIGIKYVVVDKLVFYGLALTLVSIIVFFMNYIYAKSKFSHLRIKKSIDRKLTEQIIKFSSWNAFGSFAYMIMGQGLNVLLNAFFGTVINAARGISYQVLGAIQGFASSIFTAFRPQLVQAYAAGEHKRTERLMFSMSKITFFLFYMLALPIMLEIDFILHFWLGNIVPKYTQIFTVLIILNMLISNFSTPLSLVIHATGTMKKYQIVTSAIICSTLPISWFYLKFDEDPIAVYWISIFISIINQGVCLFVVKEVFSYDIKTYFHDVLGRCLITFIISAIIPILLFISMEQSIIRLVIVTVASIISIGGVSYTFGMNQPERDLAKHILLKIRNNFTQKKCH